MKHREIKQNSIGKGRGREHDGRIITKMTNGRETNCCSIHKITMCEASVSCTKTSKNYLNRTGDKWGKEPRSGRTLGKSKGRKFFPQTRPFVTHGMGDGRVPLQIEKENK